MKVLFNKVYSSFSRLFLLAEIYNWNKTETQIYNSVLSYVCKTLSLPFHKLFRTANGNFCRDVYHQLLHYPQRMRKLILRSLDQVFRCLIAYPQYFEDIVASSAPLSLLSYSFYERFKVDKQKVLTIYGNISDNELITVLVRKVRCSQKVKR